MLPGEQASRPPSSSSSAGRKWWSRGDEKEELPSD
jgi:hypothetical protein